MKIRLIIAALVASTAVVAAPAASAGATIGSQSLPVVGTPLPPIFAPICAAFGSTLPLLKSADNTKVCKEF